MRCYIAFYDDGHDYGEFTFYSSHRANSKANYGDAKKEAQHKFGFKRARCMNITHTQLDYRD